MVAHVLRLRLALLLGAVRGDRRQVTSAVLSGLFAVVAAGAAVWALLRIDRLDDDAAAAVTVIAGATVVAGFFVAPLLGGPDDPLDPRRFAVLGATPGSLAPVTALAGMLSLPALALITASVALVVVWDAHGVPLGVSVLAGITGVVTAVLLARIAFAVSARVLRERRSRELTGVLLLALLVVAVPVGVFAASLQWDVDVPRELAGAVDILAVTPLGAAWAVPWRWQEGDPAGPLTVALLTLGLLAVAWWAVVRWLLETTERPLSVRSARGLGWFTITPGTPTGAIAARSLIYWTRDPRYIVNVVVIPIAAVVVMVPLIVVGVPLQTAVLVPAPLMALFFGWLAHNDLAYDSTAIWMHVASGVSGVADRIGRLVPPTLLAIPTLAVSISVTIGVHGDWSLLPAMIGVCAGLLLSGFGLSSISSVAAPYPVSGPGDSPFEQPQRTGGPVSQGMVLGGALVLTAPAFWAAWLTLSGETTMTWTAMWLGIGVGLFILVVGVLGGGWLFVRRASRVMEFAEAS